MKNYILISNGQTILPVIKLEEVPKVPIVEFPSYPEKKKSRAMINKENMSKSNNFFNATKQERQEMLRSAVEDVRSFVSILGKHNIKDRMYFRSFISKFNNKEILEKFFGLTNEEFNSVCGCRFENYLKVNFSKDRNYVAFNYADKFFFTSIDPNIHPSRKPKWSLQLRVCRGIIFDLNTGEVVSFPYEKIFNTSEYFDGETTNLAKKMENQGFIGSEKIDGILIQVFYCRYSKGLRFATRAQFDEDEKGYIETAADIVGRNGRNAKLKKYLSEGERPLSAMFELIDPRFRIVVKYTNSDLILHGIRNLEDYSMISFGEIQDAAKKLGFNAPEARRFNSFEELYTFQQTASEDVEGYVLRFDDGSMVKVKTEAYFGKLKGLRSLSYRAIGESLLIGADWNKFLCENIRSEELFPMANKYRTNIVRESEKIHSVLTKFVDNLLQSTRWVIYGTKEKELAISEIEFEYGRMVKYKEIDPNRIKPEDLRYAIGNLIYYKLKNEDKYGKMYNKQLIDLSVKNLTNEDNWMGGKMKEFEKGMDGGGIASAGSMNVGGAGLGSITSDKRPITPMDKEEKDKRKDQKQIGE